MMIDKAFLCSIKQDRFGVPKRMTVTVEEYWIG